jgi:hypothetical protein
MFKEGEQHNDDQEIFDEIGKEQLLPEDSSFKEELNEEPFLEERINDVIKAQDNELANSEAKANKTTLSGLRKWIGVATVMGASLLAIGCNTEKPSAEKPDNLAVGNKQDGFADKSKVEQKKVKEYKPSKKIKKTAAKKKDNNIFKIEE